MLFFAFRQTVFAKFSKADICFFGLKACGKVAGKSLYYFRRLHGVPSGCFCLGLLFCTLRHNELLVVLLLLFLS